VHCFTDSPDFVQRLLDHLPNLYIEITGVITYTINPTTAAVIRALASSPSSTAAKAACASCSRRTRRT
jgi:TatD DNase family protein